MVQRGLSASGYMQAACVAVILTFSVEGASQTLLSDALAGSTTGIQNGGQFVPGGWQAPGQITWDLGKVVTEGGMSIQVSNWNPDSASPQHHFDKQHILNMYEAAHGSPHGSDSTVPKTDYFNVRTGANYDNFFKFLSSTAGFSEGPDGRIETRVARPANFINPAQTYELRFDWTQGGNMTAKLDGAELVTHSHGQPFQLRHVFIGTDNAPNNVYGPQHDVIYSNLEVWGTSEPPDGGSGGGGTGGSGGSGQTVSTFPVIADTWSEPAAPNSTHGSDPDLRVGSDGRTIYLRFEVAGVEKVVGAMVVVEAMNAGGGGDIRLVQDNTWAEASLCHANRPQFSPVILDSLGTVDIGSSYSFDVTQAVTGNGTYSFAVTSEVEDGSGYDSKESGGAAPQLVIAWEPGSSSAGGTGGGGGGTEVDASTDTASNQGGTGGTTGGGWSGSSGSGGSGGLGGDAGQLTAPGGVARSGDEGCSCSLPARAARTGWLTWLGLAGLLVWRTRRGRPRR